MNKVEQWRMISGFYDYFVSSNGRVFSLKQLTYLKQSHDAKGYMVVNLYRNDLHHVRKVHRLVALTFLKNPDSKRSVDHINNRVSDNRLENLRFATAKENGGNRKKNKNSTSGIKGVSFNKRSNKYQAYITVDRVMIHLGWFELLEDAKNARKVRANLVFGVFTNACERM
jgi:hypothetical protein